MLVRLDRNLSIARRPSRSAVSIRAAGHALICWARGWGTYVTVVEVGGRAEPQRKTSIALIGGRCGALVLRSYARRMIRAWTMPFATLNGVDAGDAETASSGAGATLARPPERDPARPT